MAQELRLRRGSTLAHSTFTGALAEVTVDTTKKTAVVHDGVTAGGFPLARQSVADIREYGAVADATFNSTTGTWSGTDNSAAIQAAINTNLPVYIPSGNFYVASLLTYAPNGNFTIFGDGWESSVLISGCNGWTLQGAFNIDFEGFHVKGHKTSQTAATAYGWNAWGPAAHNWRIKDMAFTNLKRAARFSQCWIGQARDVYVFDCGTATEYAWSVENATNAVHFDNLQIRGGNGGTGTGYEGTWGGKGLYVGPGSAPTGGSGTECYDVTFSNLGLEHITVADAATFESPVQIYGGYWEWHRSQTLNVVTFIDLATVFGVFVNCGVVDNTSPAFPLTFIGSRFSTDLPPSANVFATADTDARSVLNLTAMGANMKLPFQMSTGGSPASLSSYGNFESCTAGGAVPAGLSDYFGAAHSLAIVADGYFNTKSMTFTNVSDSAWGGAVGLPFALKPSNRSDVYGWAIVKHNDATKGQIVLSLGGPDSNQAGKTVFSVPPNDQWCLFLLGPHNPYNNVLYVRAYGVSGGAPTVGHQITIDSWGVSFGAPNYENIYKLFNSREMAQIESDRSFQAAVSGMIYGSMSVVGTGGCSVSGPTVTYESLNVNADNREKFAHSSTGTPAGYKAVTDSTGKFPTVLLNCSNEMEIVWDTTIPSYRTRVYVRDDVFLPNF